MRTPDVVRAAAVSARAAAEVRRRADLVELQHEARAAQQRGRTETSSSGIFGKSWNVRG